MKTITVCSTKGGVGKTTLTANLGAIIADTEFRVLLIDADPQPSLSSYYAVDQSPDSTGLTDLLSSDKRISPAHTSVKNLDIIVSDDPTGSLETQLLYAADGRLRMHTGLQRIDGYDFVVIDTRGATGVIVESAALAADICLSPIPPEIMAAQEFIRGTVSLGQKPAVHECIRHFTWCTMCALIYRYDRTNDATSVSESITAAAEYYRCPASADIGTESGGLQRSLRRGVPVHIHERSRRDDASARQIMETLRNEIFGILSKPQSDGVLKTLFDIILFTTW